MSKKDSKKNEDEKMEQGENNSPEDTQPQTLEEAMEEVSEKSLRQQLDEALDEASKNLDGWQRAQAEFANYRKRTEREQTRLREDAAGRVVARFLPVVDDLRRALQDRPTNGDAAEWAAGIELVYRKLLTILENEGVTRMEVEGEFFDPTRHEAIMQVESPDHESGQIVEVIQEGYMIGERVLRAALVRVAS